MTECIGCCVYSYQVQLIERLPMHAQPHHRPERVEQPLIWTCQFLDYVGDAESGLPPPVERANGGFILHPGDCERCAHYFPAGAVQLDNLMKVRRRRRARRLKRKARQGETQG
jgi:hypothetical protein